MVTQMPISPHGRLEPSPVQSVTKRKRPNPQKTPRKELARASRRDEVVQLHREGLPYIEIAERLGVCPDTVWRDLKASAALTDARTKELSAFYREQLLCDHLEIMAKVKPVVLAAEFGSRRVDGVTQSGGSGQAGAVWLNSAREVARLTGADLSDNVEVNGDGGAGLMAGAQKGPATYALLQAMMHHGGGGEAPASARVTANTPPQL
jgi:Homeodomain-like domain